MVGKVKQEDQIIFIALVIAQPPHCGPLPISLRIHMVKLVLLEDPLNRIPQEMGVQKADGIHRILEGQVRKPGFIKFEADQILITLQNGLKFGGSGPRLPNDNKWVHNFGFMITKEEDLIQAIKQGFKWVDEEDARDTN